MFVKSLRFDLREGIKVHHIFLPFIIALLGIIGFRVAIQGYLLLGKTVSLGDLWFFFYGGMKKYIPEPGSPFIFPAVWMMLNMIICFLLVNYPLRDLNGIGQQIIVRADSRTNWWISKCCWNIGATVLYHFIISGTIITMGIFLNIKMDMTLHIDVIQFFLGIHDQLVPAFTGGFLLRYLFLPVVVSCTVNLLQLMLSLFISPTISFLVVLLWMGASAFQLSPFMIGNYAMLYRYRCILENGVSPEIGFPAVVIMIVCVIIIGLIRFRKYNILSKD